MNTMQRLRKSVALLSTVFAEDPKVSARTLHCLLIILEKGETTTKDIEQLMGLKDTKITEAAKRLRSHNLITIYQGGGDGTYKGNFYAPTEAGMSLKSSLIMLFGGNNEAT